ncbi:uncharacterized protein N7511_002561 [Penicillium nucicola]|uniref:uncharacterized protein n=1 Tax=Penicillium nucicola TaxID=1850975 RepID=UPI0025454A6C|nr:uncharacterized protein N7511_002561 [Penicillium nucicola]KAJ5770510.1 hypothetical protein N7511_002561 [Penicillium nucicola]
MQLHFRTATTEDVPQLKALIESAFRAQDTRPGWIDNLGLSNTFTIATEELITVLAKADSEMLLAFSAEHTTASTTTTTTTNTSTNTNTETPLIGSVGVSKRPGNIGRLSLLAVNPMYAADGIGRQILEYGEEYCIHAWGVEKLSLNTLSVRLQLRAWYARRGYVETGETVPFPMKRVPGLVLPDGIHMVEFEKGV